MMKKSFSFLVLSVILSSYVFSQKDLLQSGPMLGYCDLREVMIWVQTTESANVAFTYQNAEDKNKIKTPEIITLAQSAFIAKFIITELEPGTKYFYSLYINDKKVEFDFETSFETQTLWKWRTDPPEFSFATGSCAFINEEKYDRPGKPYGGDYQIFESIADKNPDFMLWLGDNVYYREVDWNTRKGMIYRSTHTRSIKEMQRLLATAHNYAIWDDHDYGPNNSDQSFWLKEDALEVFEMFWANPSTGVANIEGAISFFEWNDLAFFLLDNRFYRSPNDLKSEDKTILGKEQLDWLIESLVFNKYASFKIIAMGGQFLNDAGSGEVYSNYGFEKERQYIIDQIYEQNIQNVIFITGDRHHSELSILKKEGKPTIYDLTISPLTSSSNTNQDEDNTLRVDGTWVHERNFGLIKVTGKRKERDLIITVFDSEGKKIWDFTIEQE